jgi:hypothetical protein
MSVRAFCCSVLYTGVMMKQDVGYLTQDEVVHSDALANAAEMIWVRLICGHFDVIAYDGSEFRHYDPCDQTASE